MRKTETRDMKAVQFRKNSLQQSRRSLPPAEMEEAVFSDDKQTREENIRAVTEKLEEAFADNEEWLAVLVRLYTSIRRRQYER